MPTLRVVPRKSPKKKSPSRTKRKPASTSKESKLRWQVTDLREQIDVLLPEVTARVAALEHLLLEKRLCTRDDLTSAREFVRVQEA
ncbi:MAG TPA: hypothetical protein VLA99_17250 [Nitrospiraceae bacterium]|nr:hypothetical protein [Nitrospiraceae bacterium]